MPEVSFVIGVVATEKSCFADQARAELAEEMEWG